MIPEDRHDDESISYHFHRCYDPIDLDDILCPKPVACCRFSRKQGSYDRSTTCDQVVPRVRYARSGHGESISRPIQVKLPRATHLAMAPGSVRGHAEVLCAPGTRGTS